MSNFTQPLQVELVDGGWRTCRPLVYWTEGIIGDRVEYEVPAGFRTDFASVPRWLWSIFPPADPKYVAAAVLHDWLCSRKEFTYKFSDDLFFEAMGVLKTPIWKRWVMWTFVRIYHRWF